MRTDIIGCCCEDLPEGAPVDHHVAIRVIAGHGRILRLDIDSPPSSDHARLPAPRVSQRRSAGPRPRATEHNRTRKESPAVTTNLDRATDALLSLIP